MFWNIVIGVASFFLNMVLMPKPQSKKPASLEDFNIPVAEEGREIPVVFGTVHIKSPNVVWYGDFRVAQIKGERLYGLFGPRVTEGYQYFLGMHMVLCHGVHDEIREIWAGDHKIWPNLGSPEIAYGNTIALIDQLNVWGGEEGEGGIYGYIHVLGGAPGQGQDGYLVQKMGEGVNTPAFRGVVSVIWPQLYIGNTPYLKYWEFFLKRIHRTSRGVEQWYDAKAAVPDTHNTSTEPGVELINFVTTFNGHMKIDTNGEWVARVNEGTDADHGHPSGALRVWHLPDGAEQEYDPPNPNAGIWPTGKFGGCVHITEYDEVVLQWRGSIWGNVDVYLQWRDCNNIAEQTQEMLNLTNFFATWIGPGGPVTTWTNLNWGPTVGEGIGPNGVSYLLMHMGPTVYPWNPWMLFERQEDEWIPIFATNGNGELGNSGGTTQISMGPRYAYCINGYWSTSGVSRVSWYPDNEWSEDMLDLAAIGVSGAPGSVYTIAYCWATNEVVLLCTTGIYILNAEMTVVLREAHGVAMNLTNDSKRFWVGETTFVYLYTNNVSFKYLREFDIVSMEIVREVDVFDSSYVNKNSSSDGAFYYNRDVGGIVIGKHFLMPLSYWPYAPPDALDMNPAHIIRECLTDRTWGMGYAAADIDDASFTYAADVLYQELFGLSLQWTKEEELQEFISMILSHIDAYLYLRRTTGKFYLKLIRNDYDLGTIPVIDEDDVVFWDEVVRRGPPEAVGSITVKYTDRRNRGKDASTSWDSIGQIQQLGQRISVTRNYPGISRAGLAARVAKRDQTTLGIGMISGRLTGTRTLDVLYPGDPFRLVSSRHNLDGEVMRVASLKFGDGRTNSVGLKFVQDVFRFHAEELVDSSQGDWETPQEPAEPSEPRLVWEMPLNELHKMIGSGDTTTMLSVSPGAGMIEAAGARPSPNAQDAQLMVDGVVEETMTWAPAGTLVGNIGRLDTAVTIENETDVDGMTVGMLAVLMSAADNANPNLMEIVRVDGIAGTNLTLSRGMLDTVPKAYVEGDWFVAYDDFAMPDFEQRAAGESVSVRILTRTLSEQLTEETAPADSVTLDSRAIRPFRPANVKINGVIDGGTLNDPIDVTSNFEVTWSRRNRLSELTSLQEWTDGDVTPEAGQTTVIEIWNYTHTVLYTSYTAIAGTSYTVPIGAIGGSAWADVGSERDGYREWQSYGFLLTNSDLFQSMTAPLHVDADAFYTHVVGQTFDFDIQAKYHVDADVYYTHLIRNKEVDYLGEITGVGLIEGEFNIGSSPAMPVLAIRHSKVSGSNTIATVTFDGVNATEIVQTAANSRGAGVAYLQSLMEGLVTFTIIGSDPLMWISASVYSVRGIIDTIPIDTTAFGGTNNPTGPLDTGGSGVIIAAGTAGGTTTSQTPITFTGVDIEDWDNRDSEWGQHAAAHAHTNVQIGRTVGLSSAQADEWFAAIAWGDTTQRLFPNRYTDSDAFYLHVLTGGEQPKVASYWSPFTRGDRNAMSWDDPYWSSVVLLLRAEGADASTTFIDSSRYARTLTVQGNAQVDTAQFKYGAASALFDGSGDAIVASDASELHFGTNPFTVRLWVRFASGSPPLHGAFVGQWGSLLANCSWFFYLRDGMLRFRIQDAATSSVYDSEAAWAPAINTWYHVAADRDASNKIRVYVNGSMIAGTVITQTIRDGTGNLGIGTIPGFESNAPLDGWIDELEIYNGVALYASDGGYVVPTASAPGAAVVVTTTAVLGGGTPSNWVDGLYGSDVSQALWWNDSQTLREIKFDFGSPKIMDGFRWFQSTNFNHGTWVFEASPDDVSYAQYGSSFSLGTIGSLLVMVYPFEENTSAYRYYKLRQISGVTEDAPWLHEMELSLGETGDPVRDPREFGDRTSFMTVTTTAALGASSGTIDKVIDGGYSNAAADSVWFVNGQTLREIKFDLGSGVTRTFTGFYWIQDTSTVGHGTWVMEGSQDDSTYYPVGPVSFTLGTFALQITTWHQVYSNSYRYYKFRQISGTTSQTPYIMEVEFRVSPTPSVRLRYMGKAEDASDQTIYNFAGKDLGQPAADRRVHVKVVGSQNTRTVATLKVGGQTATKNVEHATITVSTAAILTAYVPEGTTGDIEVTWSGGQNRCAIDWWVSYGLPGNDAYSVDSAINSGGANYIDYDVDVDTADGSFILVGGLHHNASAGSLLYQPATINSRHFTLLEGTAYHYAGDGGTDGSMYDVRTTSTGTTNGNSPMVAASFSPFAAIRPPLHVDTDVIHAPTLPPPSGDPWTPNVILGQVYAWWDHSVMPEVDLATVTTVADASGRGRPLTTQGSPTAKAAAQNGLKALNLFGATNRHASFYSGGMAIQQSAQVFIVGKSGASTSDTNKGGWIDTGTDGAVNHYTYGGGIYYDFNSNSRKSAGSKTVNVWHQMTLWSAPSDWGYAMDGVDFFTTTSNTMAIAVTGYYFGDANSGWSNQGEAGEGVVTLNKLSTQDRQRMEGYLAHKWGIQSRLLATHPYKTYPPTHNVPPAAVTLGNEYVEIWCTGDNNKVRLDTEYVEVWQTGDPSLQKVRLDAEYVEVWVPYTLSKVRLNTQYAEVINSGGVGNDPFFSNVVVLTGGSGADASTTFVDRSVYARALTAVGNVQNDIGVTILGNTTILFDGNGDYITAADATELEIGSQDFTIEAYVQYAALSNTEGGNAIAAKYSNTGNQRSWYFKRYHIGSVQELVFAWSTDGASGGSSVGVGTAWTPSTGVTYHLAVSRNGSTVRLFIDGVLHASTTGVTDTFFNSTAVLRIGAIDSSAGFRAWMDGSMQDFRMTVGVGRYTANFTPPPSTLRGNTTRLGGQYAEVIYYGDAAQTVKLGGQYAEIIHGGDTAAEKVRLGGMHVEVIYRDYSGPTDPDFLNVVALLGFEGADGSTTFTNEAVVVKTTTANGNVQIDTAQSKFGSGSGLFDAVGDFISYGNDADFTGNQNFTCEAWIRLNSLGRISTIAGKRASSSASEWTFEVTTSNVLQFAVFNAGAAVGAAVGATTLTTGVWYHVACTMSGTTMRVFVDGILDGSATRTNTVQTNSTAFVVGRNSFNTGRDFDGWIDEFRFTKSVARYTATFTPPTAAFPRYPS